MSRTLHLTCDDCNKTLWVGQNSSRIGWYLYGTDVERERINQFVRDHIGHRVRFQDSEQVGFDVNDVTQYDET